MDRYGKPIGHCWHEHTHCGEHPGLMIALNAVEKGERGPQGVQGPQGSAGVMVSATQPQDEQIQVWICDRGEYDENGALLNAAIYVRNAQGEFKALESIRGDAPVLGEDYWTEQDRAEIKAYVDDTINNAGGVAVDSTITANGTNPVNGKAVTDYVVEYVEQELAKFVDAEGVGF